MTLLADVGLNPISWTAGGWAAGAGWLTLSIAAAAARYARRQWLDARDTRDEQTQPYVVVDVEPSPASYTIWDLVIRNIGATIAHNVRIRFEPPLVTASGRLSPDYKLEDSSLIREGIGSMPPGREYRMIFDDAPARYDSELPRRYDVTVSYDDRRGLTHTDTSVLDLNVFFGTTYLEVRTEHHSAKALEAIAKELATWTQRGNGLRAYTMDEDALHAREQAAMKERMREHQELQEQRRREQEATRDDGGDDVEV